tara:strand:+ start:318 stop:602 length:285 start_codon:yes stop_codon:yes gene_type:complete
MKLDRHENNIVGALNEERESILSLSYMNSELRGRLSEINRQIGDIVGGDTFRSYELEAIGDLCNDNIDDDLDVGFDGNSHGFISNSFKDPDENY